MVEVVEMQTPASNLPLVVSFFVPGTPRPQGSKRAIVHRTTGRAVVIESGGHPLTDWRGDVKRAAMEAMADRGPIDGPIELLLAFRLRRPKSHPKTRRTWPVARPDVDKLARSVMDALTSVCFLDDAQVVELRILKAWGEQPGVKVTLGEVVG